MLFSDDLLALVVDRLRCLIFHELAVQSGCLKKAYWADQAD